MQQHQYTARDDSPIAVMYRQYAPVIFAYLCRHTAYREDAEDLLLEVFLAAMEHSKFAELVENEQQSWLWAVARNKVVDHYRRSTRHASINLMQAADTVFENEELAPDQVALRNEEYAHLHVKLKELPALQQEVLRLRFGNSMRCSEIAAILEKSEGSVRMLLSRTLKLLRTIYEQH
ncbi:MAG TPA: RNA polymerase sigma factor [Ktedonobacteraceae bacterium]|jgi:RNA polymerase sigma-70 factor (ECF subfamily)|nr:RNA polymerase sigma factor [Ktedonobacteraceae bacterium]